MCGTDSDTGLRKRTQGGVGVAGDANSQAHHTPARLLHLHALLTGWRGGGRLRDVALKHVLENSALSDAVSSITKAIGIGPDLSRVSVEETVGSFLSDTGIDARVVSYRWGRLVIETADSAESMKVAFFKSQIEDLIVSAGHDDVDVFISVRR